MKPAPIHRDGITALTVVTGIAGVLFGVIVGYLLGAGSTPPAPGAGTIAEVAAQGSAQPVLNESELQGYRNILASDPKNAKAATELGNRLYDAGRYADAIPYYQQAFANDPRNINVSTDLGTALWYAGRADDALAQFQRSLAFDPKHPQTLFNVGIVRSDGKQDAAGAIQAWEALLNANPSYPDASKVRTLIDNAKQKLGATAAPPVTSR